MKHVMLSETQFQNRYHLPLFLEDMSAILTSQSMTHYTEILLFQGMKTLKEFIF